MLFFAPLGRWAAPGAALLCVGHDPALEPYFDLR